MLYRAQNPGEPRGRLQAGLLLSKGVVAQEQQLNSPNPLSLPNALSCCQIWQPYSVLAQLGDQGNLIGVGGKCFYDFVGPSRQILLWGLLLVVVMGVYAERV